MTAPTSHRLLPKYCPTSAQLVAHGPVGGSLVCHFFDQFSAPLLDHFWPPEWSHNPPTIDAKLLPHRASKFTSFMAHFCPPLASERERCWAQNLEFSLAFAIYYENRLFSFLVVSVSSFAPPPGLNSSTQNIRHSTKKCIQTRAEIHPDVLNCVATFWLHFGTHVGSTLAPFFVKMSQPKCSPLAFFLPCSLFGPRARQSEPIVYPLWTPTAPQTTPK